MKHKCLYASVWVVLVISVCGVRGEEGKENEVEEEEDGVWQKRGAILTLGDFYPNQIPTGELDPVGLSHHLAVLAAITDNNNMQPHNSSSVILVIQNNFNNGLAVSSSYSALSLLSQGSVALLGTVSSSATEYSQGTVAMPKSAPIVSGAADAISLSNYGENPFFLGVYPSNLYEANAINALLNMYQVRTVAAFYRPTEDSSLSLLSQLTLLSQSSQWEIVSVYVVDYTDTNFNEELIDLASLHVDCVLLFPWDTEITATVFSQAYELGLAGGDSEIQWIVDDYSLTPYGFEIGGKVSATAVKGWENAIGFVAQNGTGSVYARFLDSYHREWYEKYTNHEAGYPEMPDPKAAYSYDAVFVYSNAISTLLSLGLNPFDPIELNKYIRKVKFTGATGEVSFSGNQRAAEIPFDLWVARNGTLEAIGYSYNKQVSFTAPFYWAGDGSVMSPQRVTVMLSLCLTLGLSLFF